MKATIHAAWKGHGEVVAALLKGGCDVDKADDYGASPLFVAAGTWRRRVVPLIKGGCNVDKAKNNGATLLLTTGMPWW